MRKQRTCHLIMLMVAFLTPSNSYSYEQDSFQDAVENTVLQLPRYVTISGKTGASLVLCVNANPSFVSEISYLNQTSKSYAQIKEVSEPASCDVFYIETSKMARRILSKNELTNLLTISRYDTFIDEGGVVNITDKNGKLNIGINLSAAKENHINFSAALIELATRVIQ